MKKRGFILLLLTLLALAIAVVVKWQRATDPHLSLGEWERAEIWWKKGQCQECHQPLGKGSEAVLEPQPASPPHYHADPDWAVTHGRGLRATESRCLSCHQVQNCRSCHATRPDTHSRDFVSPRGDTPGVRCHAALGRARPSACLTCHGSFTVSCSSCHTASELEPLREKAERDLERWVRLRAKKEIR